MRRRAIVQYLLATPLGLVAPGAPLAQSGESQIRRLRFTLTFINPFERALTDQQFWCYLPASATPSQRLAKTQVSHPHRISTDALGHQILALSFAQLPALAQKVVTVTTEVELGAADALEALPMRASWLGAERFIEADDPRLRAAAANLRQGTEVDTARAIYAWVRGHMTYAGYLATDLGALHALLKGKGDCTEFADLVVALARASGLPARLVGGYVVEHDSAPKPQDYHDWAEIYLGGAWRVVDAQKGNWLAPRQYYIAFRIYRDAPANAVGLAHRYRVQGEMQVAL